MRSLPRSRLFRDIHLSGALAEIEGLPVNECPSSAAPCALAGSIDGYGAGDRRQNTLRQERSGPIVVRGAIGLPQYINARQIGCSRHSDLVLCRDLLFKRCLDGRILVLCQRQSIGKGEGMVRGRVSRFVLEQPKRPDRAKKQRIASRIWFPVARLVSCSGGSYHRSSTVHNISWTLYRYSISDSDWMLRFPGIASSKCRPVSNIGLRATARSVSRLDQAQSVIQLATGSVPCVRRARRYTF